VRTTIIGIIIGTALTLVFAILFFMGVFMGVMGTDSCRHVDDGPIVYLFFVWPTLLLIAAWAPSTLYWLKVRTSRVLVIGIFLGVGSILAYLIYPFWLDYACHR
jgi:hypothetical protein